MNSRAKGARGEREWAGVLAEHYPHLEFARGIQTRGGGKEAADVFGLPGIHWEVKRVESLNIWAALAQADRDAEEGDIPVVAFRRNRSGWFAALPADRFLGLLSDATAIPILG